MGREKDPERWETLEDGSTIPRGRGGVAAPERHRDPKPSEPESTTANAGTDQPELEQTEEQKAADEQAEEQAEQMADAQTDEPAPAPEAEPAGSNPDIDATDGAIEYANEVGIDITTVSGTGLNGRITKGDVEAAYAAQQA